PVAGSARRSRRSASPSARNPLPRLVHERGGDGGGLRWRQTVQDPLREGLGDQKVAVPVDPGEYEPLRLDGEVVHVPEILQDAEDPLELTGQRLGPAPDPPFDALDLLLEPAGAG